MLDDELMNAYRNNDRLRTKNGVIITQRNKLMQQIKMHMAETEVLLIITIKTRLVELSWSKKINNVWQTYLHRSVAPSILLSCSWKIQNYSKYCNLKTERWVTILIMLSVVMCDVILQHLRCPILFAWNISGYRGERCNIKHSQEKES